MLANYLLSSMLRIIFVDDTSNLKTDLDHSYRLYLTTNCIKKAREREREFSYLILSNIAEMKRQLGVQLGKGFNYFVVHLAGTRRFFSAKSNEVSSANFPADSFFSPGRREGNERLLSGSDFVKTTIRNNRVTDNSAWPHLFDHGGNISWRGKLCRRNSYRFLSLLRLCARLNHQLHHHPVQPPSVDDVIA